MEFKFSKIGKNLGTRDSGAHVRREILQKLNSFDRIVFDFEEVRIVTNSFADECFAKMLDTISIEELQRKTSFINTNDVVLSSIITAFNRRLNKQD